MAPLATFYGWKPSTVESNSTTMISSEGDVVSKDINTRLKEAFLTTLCSRPSVGLTEVRKYKYLG